jgi:hypothetical protein
LTSSDGLSGLFKDVTITWKEESKEILTERRIPMLVKIAPTGGYASKINIRLQIPAGSPRLT